MSPIKDKGSGQCATDVILSTTLNTMPSRQQRRDGSQHSVGGRRPMEQLNDLLTEQQAAAVEHLRVSLGFDPAQTFGFWENLLAHVTAGEITSTLATYDLDLLGTRVEVKYSREFLLRLGKSRSQSFRWTGINGHGTVRGTATVLLLVGLDTDRNVWFWVVPYSELRGKNTITCVVPSRRVKPGRNMLEGYESPSHEILPRILHFNRVHERATGTSVDSNQRIGAAA